MPRYESRKRMLNRGGLFKHEAEQKTLDRLTELELFEQFREEILPELQADLKAGLTADEIYSKYQRYVAARAVTIALREVDSSKAMSAVKDILDRHGGKPTERRETTHKYEKMADQELDALLISQATELDSLTKPARKNEQ